jgi:AraC-like DNA-binding protein
MQQTDSRSHAARAMRREEGLSRIGPIQAVPEVLEQLGVDASALFAQLGIARQRFANANNFVPNAEVSRLLCACVERTRCPHFGLLVGAKSGLASLGLLGSLARHAPDVGSALRAINRHLGLNNTVGIATLAEHGNLAMWSYAIYEPGLPGADQVYQCAAALACNILRELCGPGWAPKDVLLACARPRDTQPFRSFFGAPVRFDVEHASIVFARSWLAQPVCSADATRHRTLLRHAAAMEGRIADALPDLVCRAMRRLLITGRASMAEVAAAFSLHRRTLDRQLEAHGVTFRALATRVRFAVAQQLLRDTDMPIGEIASVLHYANPGAFATAFRQWSGVTASAWRAQARGESRFAGPVAAMRSKAS